MIFSNLGSISSVSVNIKRIAGVSLSAEIKNDATDRKMKAYAFWDVSESPFSFTVGYCLAFYSLSISPSVWLIGFRPDKLEVASIAIS